MLGHLAPVAPVDLAHSPTPTHLFTMQSATHALVGVYTPDLLTLMAESLQVRCGAPPEPPVRGP